MKTTATPRLASSASSLESDPPSMFTARCVGGVLRRAPRASSEQRLKDVHVEVALELAKQLERELGSPKERPQRPGELRTHEGVDDEPRAQQGWIARRPGGVALRRDLRLHLR